MFWARTVQVSKPTHTQAGRPHAANPGTGRRLAFAAVTVGFDNVATAHGPAGLFAASVVTVLMYAAIVISAALPEWYRLRALREPGRQVRWLVTHTSSAEQVEKLGELLLAAHAQTVNAVTAPD